MSFGTGARAVVEGADKARGAVLGAYAKAGSVLAKPADILTGGPAGIIAGAGVRAAQSNAPKPDVTKQNWDGFLGRERQVLSEAKGALQTFGAVMGLVTGLEQAVSGPFMKIPFPAFPALRVGDTDVGLPHGHSHPPNLIPPAPMILLPSIGPVIPIPYVSGAHEVLINGRPAARCGDMGLGVWCGGFVPMFEIFLGSASVWIEGARAARTGVDITNHCIFSARKGPDDKPIGAFVGTTIDGSPDVLIGGIPMPSLTNMAMGLAMKGAGRVVKTLIGKKRCAAIAEKIAAMKSKAKDAAKKVFKRAEEAGDTLTDMPGFHAGDTLPGVGVHANTVKMDVVDIVLHEFPQETRDLIKKSPTLKKQVHKMNEEGWIVKREKEPSRIERNAKEIVVKEGTPHQEAQAFSHESGHYDAGEPQYTKKSGVSEDEYVRRNTDEIMDNEGKAQFNNAKARDEILQNSNGADDIGQSGRKANEYQDVYDRHKNGEITKDQAVDEMADKMRDEHMGTSPTDTYEQHHNDFYRDNYSKPGD